MKEKESHKELICKICGNNSGNTPWITREMMYGMRDEFLYFQCGKCLCLQIAEFPADMSKYYPKNYYSFNKYEGGNFKGIKGWFKRKAYRGAIFGKGIFENISAKFFKVPDAHIFHDLEVTTATKILDVGCGNGRSFLFPLAESGFQNLLGCDPFIESPIDYHNGLKILKCPIFGIVGKWDIITYHHSFEHLPDPQENLNFVAGLLEPKGVCIVRIPTASSYAWEHYRTNWAQLDAPRHFFLHSRESIRLISEKAGLELYNIVDDSRHFQFSGSEKHVADTSLKAPRKKGMFNFLKRKWNKMKFKRWAKKLNKEGKGDQAVFFLRKKLN